MAPNHGQRRVLEHPLVGIDILEKLFKPPHLTTGLGDMLVEPHLYVGVGLDPKYLPSHDRQSLAFHSMGGLDA